MSNEQKTETTSENITNEQIEHPIENDATENDTLAEENTDFEAINAEEVIKEEENIEANLEKITYELEEAKDKYLRLYADFENFRRRVAKEKSDLIRNAGEDLIKNLIPIVDDFERANKSIQKGENTEFTDNATAQKEITALKEGIYLVFNKLVRTLEQRGLKAMESSIGKPFNIDEQESITQIPAPNEEMKGKVIDEIEKGYYLNDKVLRFAKVVVGS